MTKGRSKSMPIFFLRRTIAPKGLQSVSKTVVASSSSFPTLLIPPIPSTDGSLFSPADSPPFPIPETNPSVHRRSASQPPSPRPEQERPVLPPPNGDIIVPGKKSESKPALRSVRSNTLLDATPKEISDGKSESATAIRLPPRSKHTFVAVVKGSGRNSKTTATPFRISGERGEITETLLLDRGDKKIWINVKGVWNSRNRTHKQSGSKRPSPKRQYSLPVKTASPDTTDLPWDRSRSLSITALVNAGSVRPYPPKQTSSTSSTNCSKRSRSNSTKRRGFNSRTNRLSISSPMCSAPFGSTLKLPMPHTFPIPIIENYPALIAVSKMAGTAPTALAEMHLPS